MLIDHRPLLGLLAGWVVLAASTGANAQRVSNNTLGMPEVPPGGAFEIREAFPGLAFPRPVSVVFPPGDTNRVLVASHDGQITLVPDVGSPGSETFMDLRSQVHLEGEMGLLSLAFHPGFETNRFFFVCYNRRDPVTGERYDRLARFSMDGSGMFRGDPDSEVVLIDQLDEASNHQGGDMKFGQDGFLYLSLGDEGGAFDSYQNSQRVDRDFFSAILRLDVDEDPANPAPNDHPSVAGNYRVPADNPWIGVDVVRGTSVDPAEVRTEFYAVGLRNPWQLDIDPISGMLFVGDTGQHEREEANVVLPGSNHGWANMEGTVIHESVSEPLASDQPFLLPLAEYGREAGSVIAGTLFYRGDALPTLDGCLVVSDFASGGIGYVRFGGTGKEAALRRHAADLERLHAEIAAADQADRPALRLAVEGVLREAAEELGAGPAPVIWIANEGGISRLFQHPGTGSILMADYADGKIRELVETDPEPQESIPELLSETGVFADLESLVPEAGVEPYEINVPFWSDNAIKRRWFCIPDAADQVVVDENGGWTFPAGTVWVKHFEIETIAGLPETRRRLETRLLIRRSDGEGVYGVTYRWNEAETDAVLVSAEGADEELAIWEQGESRTRTWRYPSRSECTRCHNSVVGFALGFREEQLNLVEAGGANQLERFNDAGYFDGLAGSSSTWKDLHPADELEATLTGRVRSFLDVNCAYCHQPGGEGRGSWDARKDISLEAMGLIGGQPLDPLGDEANRLIAPGDADRSVVFKRLSELGAHHMPPLATDVLNAEAVALLREWIEAETQAWSEGGNVPPRVYWLNPGSNDRWLAPAELELNVAASDSDGSIASVRFLRNGALLGEDASAPFKFTWSSVPEGHYLFEALAVDDAGGQTSVPLGTVSVATDVQELSESISGLKAVSGDAVSLTVPELEGVTVVVEASTNLVDWAPVRTNRVADGNLLFLEGEWSGHPGRYYRLVIPVGGAR